MRAAQLLVAALLALAPAMASADPVATVEGPRGTFTIESERLQRYLAEHPDRSPRQALADLIDFELLAAEAEAAGLAAHPDVAAAVDRAAAAAWLRGDFEAKWTAEHLPEDTVRRSYAQNRGFFDHPELREGAHILVTTAEAQRPAGDQDEVARQLAEQIHAALVADPPDGADAFRAAGRAFEAQAEAVGLVVKAQSLGKFARRGRYADEFEDAAFAIERAGVAAEPFPSRFGWHIVRLDAIIPEKRQSFAEAEAELRAKIVPEVRRLEFLRATDDLAAGRPPLREVPGARGLLDPVPLDIVALRRGLLDPPPETAPEAPPGREAPER